MKILFLTLLVALTALTGCASRYNITLTNDRVVTAHSKPKLNAEKNAYQFKDATGQPASVPVFRVKQIEPR